MPWLVLALLLLAPGPVRGQAGADPLVEGRALAPRDPRAALVLFARAVGDSAASYEAHWRSAVALVDLGQEFPDSIRSPTRDSLYRAAERHARRAVTLQAGRPEGHFVLAMTLGRVALTKPSKDRVRYAVAIYEAATRTIELAPDHDGAHHILGLWHAEGRRTSGFNRFMARTMFGGTILGKASWARAIEHLETAVRLDPGRIYHRLDLARVYADRHRYSDARRELDRIAELPDRERPDPIHRREAARLATRIEGQPDRLPADTLPE